MWFRHSKSYFNRLVEEEKVYIIYKFIDGIHKNNNYITILLV